MRMKLPYVLYKHQKQRNIFSTIKALTELFASHENKIIIKENTENSFYTQQ